MSKKSKTVSENLQDELEPIKDFLEEAEKEKKEYYLKNKEAKLQSIVINSNQLLREFEKDGH